MTVHDVARIEEKLDRVTAGATIVSDNIGGVMFQNMSEVLEFSKLMSLADVAVPKHLRGNPGACLRIVTQALEWRMSPFSVADKSYCVSDKIAYESQLVHAVIEQRAPIKGRLRHRYEGEGDQRICIVWATPKGESEPLEWRTPPISQITPKNSPLWKTKPDLQLYYVASRDWARVYFPDVLLGIYSEDELEATGPQYARDVTPKPDIATRLSGSKGKRGFSHEGVETALVEHKPGQVVDVAKAKEPVAVGGDPELPASLDRRAPPHDESAPDEVAQWLDEQIAIANNLKTSEELDELDPRVWKRLKDEKRAKDLGEKWETEGFNPNMNRLDPARKPKK